MPSLRAAKQREKTPPLNHLSDQFRARPPVLLDDGFHACRVVRIDGTYACTILLSHLLHALRDKFTSNGLVLLGPFQEFQAESSIGDWRRLAVLREHAAGNQEKARTTCEC